VVVHSVLDQQVVQGHLLPGGTPGAVVVVLVGQAVAALLMHLLRGTEEVALVE
jgi:hypothetical protein